MANYRLYSFGPRFKRIEAVESFDAPDDESALAIFAARTGDSPTELWSGGRKVASSPSSTASAN